jgi:SP family arabinose:H+ symporter-like MFS transporter
MNDKSSGSRLYVLTATCVGALGGLLFGYDTAVISGAERYLQKHFALDSAMTGWAASSALVGCIVGAALAGALADAVGRKKGLLVCALLYVISGIGTAVPQTLDQLVWMRFVAGLGIGAASMISPMYIAEIAPAGVRGRLVAVYQLAIVVGILLVFFVNMLIQRQGDAAWNTESGWRWMFAAGIPPAVLFGLAITLVPESPRWLMKANRRDEALVVLQRVGGPDHVAAEVPEIDKSLSQTQGTFTELFTRYRRPLVMGVLLAVFSQFSGINTVMYYGPRIFEKIEQQGHGTFLATLVGDVVDPTFLSTVLVGVVNLIFTLLAMWLIDQVGRKLLLTVGTFVQFLALGSVAWLCGTGGAGELQLAGILLFCAAFAAGNGVVCWVLISEIFPNRVRGRAMSLATLCLWAACYLVSQTFPMLIDEQKGIGLSLTFWMYGGFGLLNSLYVLLAVPETRRRSLEQIEASWTVHSP